MTEHHLHQSHPEIIKRLRRAEGHIKSVIGMMETGRSCLDVAHQLHAVEMAISQAKRTLIQDHIDHCLEHAMDEEGEARIRSLSDFRAITKYL